MKLRNIFESGISRRDFLKRGVAGAVSLSPLGKLLASSGVAPAIVKSVEAGIVKPWTFPFTVMTNTHYGRGGSPLLSRQFENVGRAASLTRRLTSGGMKFGADEDAFFAGELSAQKFADIVKAAKDEEDIEINGQIFQAFDDEDSIYLYTRMGFQIG